MDCFEQLLKESKFDAKKSQYLVNGFRKGFSIGYVGPEHVQITSKNLRFRGIGDETELWNKVMKEVKLKRYTGPFETVPYTNFIQSPIGLVPKDGGNRTRLIFHLSHPRGTNKSVNANTPPEICKVRYPKFDEAVKLCAAAGKNCQAGKSDMTSAFRHLGICRKHWKLLVMKAKSPIDGKMYFSSTNAFLSAHL